MFIEIKFLSAFSEVFLCPQSLGCSCHGLWVLLEHPQIHPEQMEPGRGILVDLPWSEEGLPCGSGWRNGDAKHIPGFLAGAQMAAFGGSEVKITKQEFLQNHTMP